MPNPNPLTASQVALTQYIATAHRGGESAKVDYSVHNHVTLKSLIARGLVRHLNLDTNGAAVYYCDDMGRVKPGVFEIELTRSGWDYLWGFKRQP